MQISYQIFLFQVWCRVFLVLILMLRAYISKVSSRCLVHINDFVHVLRHSFRRRCLTSYHLKRIASHYTPKDGAGLFCKQFVELSWEKRSQCHLSLFRLIWHRFWNKRLPNNYARTDNWIRQTMTINQNVITQFLSLFRKYNREPCFPSFRVLIAHFWPFIGWSDLVLGATFEECIWTKRDNCWQPVNICSDHLAKTCPAR